MSATDLFAWGALLIVLACTVWVASKVRERRRKARRAMFLREREYKDHVAGEWRRNHTGNLPKE